MNHVVNTKQKGFTLVELMLAMTFIAVLLLAIALTVIQVGAMYNKGMTLKETNQAGRDITTDIQRTIAASENFSLENDYIVTNSEGASGFGRLCLGTYTYIWNLGNTNVSSLVVYENVTKAATRINLVKLSDPAKLYCAKDSEGDLVTKNIRDIDTAKTKELLNAGDHSLVIYKLLIAEGSASTSDALTGQQLYQIRFSISTSNFTAIDTSLDICLPPGDVDSDINYCSVQDFSLVVRAGNRVN